MKRDALPTPVDLTDAPELAILATLECALTTAGYALIAAHPELAAGDDLSEHNQVAAHTWIADAIIAQAELLRGNLARYRHVLRQHERQGRVDTNGNDF